MVLSGVIVGLLVGPSTAAASGWSAPAVVDPPVAPTTAHSVFVSCSSASFCAAVDYEGNALTFNGSSWSAPAKIDGTAYGLTSVSCPSASFCVAVDHGGNALTFNGSSWSAPTSIDGTGNVLTAVSCPSASFCVAVDLDFSAWAAHLLGYGYVVTFNGSSWSAPARIGVGGLESVSCPSASFCGAVNDDGGALTFNGSTWNAPTRLLSGPPGYAALPSVSCSSPSFCATVDQQGDAWTFNGSSWSYAPIDGLLPLTSVSCPSESFCIAVDRGTSAGYEHYPGGHALTFNGSTWSAPTTIDNVALNSVSCPSASFCVAFDYLGQALTYSSPSSSGGGGISGGAGGTLTTAPVNVSPPVISGTAKVGQRLSASPGTWSGKGPVSYHYEWQRCNPGCSAIAGATTSSRTLTAADLGVAVRVVVTASNSSGSAQAGSRQVGPIAPTAAQIKAQLRAQLSPSGKAGKIAALLKKGGYTISFNSLSGGGIVIDWYRSPKGAKVSNAKPKPMLVATGKANFSRASRVKLTIKLNRAGKRMLKPAKHLQLTAKGTYTPTGNPPVIATKTFTLKR
jgi:hypothetical protein